jgi:hypothetical protein
MGDLVPFHARTSAGGRAARAASVSKLIALPLSRANSTTAAHLSAGIRSRARQLLTTGAATPTASATAVVPPKSSMISATDMPAIYFTPCEHVKVHGSAGDFLVAPWTIGSMAATAKEIGLRLQSMHKALEISQADVCRATGLKPGRYSQYVNGERRLTMDAAILVADHYPVTMDWLIRGNIETLPMAVHRKITRAA